MSFNPLSNFKIERWYHVIIVFSAAILCLSLTMEMKGVENTTVQIFSLGFLLLGLGEWINHPTQTTIEGHFKITGYGRRFSFIGSFFDILGIIILIIGVVKVL